MSDEHKHTILTDAIEAAFLGLQREIADLKRRIQWLEERAGGSVDRPPASGPGVEPEWPP
jgi:hypothetical protein